MPETSMHENYRTPAREHEVRPARKVPAVQPKAKAARVETATQQKFRLRIPAADAAHIEAALLRREDVDHHRLMVPLRPRQCSAGPQ